MRAGLIFSVFLSFALAASVTFFAPGARAGKSHYTPSSSREVAYAFYKMAGGVPNFRNWVESSKPYQEARLSDRPEILQAQTLKFRQEFANFDPKENPIVVKVQGDIALKEITTPELPDPSDLSGPAAILDVAFSKEVPDTPYFPFEVSGQWIAVVIANADMMRGQNVGADVTSRLKPMMYMMQVGFYELKGVDLVFKLIPENVDARAPILLDGEEQWLMMTRVASISIWNSKGEFMWEYSAPDYVSPVKLELKRLFRE